MDAGEVTHRDTKSVDCIIDALYEVISGPAGEERDWDRLRRLFLPGGRLIPTDLPIEGIEPRPMDVEEFIALAGPVLSTMDFYEVEIHRVTEKFGPMVHAFSTYESRSTPNGEPFIRGINSIQLQYKDDRWWVVTMFWANELPGQPIPDKYLP
ncbi:hypothetical protein [Kibdelosporangium aridum]|uniref:hypothetical protein n=1 Tax=Kibdelosporangium aridum TaxID=2030 RepID=UPI00068996B6